jgi:thiamine biosynthesis lipoprotein
VNGNIVRSIPAMGTIVTAEIVDGESRADDATAAIDRALAWFAVIERSCSRFDPDSELKQLTERVGVAVPVSEPVLAAVTFALAVADETSGAFDPTVGYEMERRGFDRHYRTGAAVRSTLALNQAVSYRDVIVDPVGGTITLRRPLVLDLGAVAKGLALDMAARELAPLGSFAVDAGGDLYFGGRNRSGEPWSVGIRHPRADREVIEVVRVSDRAVCTSGDYERRDTGGAGSHIVDPRNGRAADVVVSATVVAPTAMLADALATAAFVLGPVDGLELLRRHGVEGVLFTPELERMATEGFPGGDRAR